MHASGKYLKDGKPSLAAIQVGILLMILASLALSLVLTGFVIARATALFMGL